LPADSDSALTVKKISEELGATIEDLVVKAQEVVDNGLSRDAGAP